MTPLRYSPRPRMSRGGAERSGPRGRRGVGCWRAGLARRSGPRCGRLPPSDTRSHLRSAALIRSAQIGERRPFHGPPFARLLGRDDHSPTSRSTPPSRVTVTLVTVIRFPASRPGCQVGNPLRLDSSDGHAAAGAGGAGAVALFRSGARRPCPTTCLAPAPPGLFGAFAPKRPSGDRFHYFHHFHSFYYFAASAGNRYGNKPVTGACTRTEASRPGVGPSDPLSGPICVRSAIGSTHSP